MAELIRQSVDYYLKSIQPDKYELVKKAKEAADGLQYPDLDSNRYEDDYSQLPDEELCQKYASSR